MKEIIASLGGKRRIGLAFAITSSSVMATEIPHKVEIGLALLFFAVLFGGADILGAVRK